MSVAHAESGCWKLSRWCNQSRGWQWWVPRRKHIPTRHLPHSGIHTWGTRPRMTPLPTWLHAPICQKLSINLLQNKRYLVCGNKFLFLFFFLFQNCLTLQILWYITNLDMLVMVINVCQGTIFLSVLDFLLVTGTICGAWKSIWLIIKEVPSYITLTNNHGYQMKGKIESIRSGKISEVTQYWTCTLTRCCLD